MKSKLWVNTSRITSHNSVPRVDFGFVALLLYLMNYSGMKNKIFRV